MRETSTGSGPAISQAFGRELDRFAARRTGRVLRDGQPGYDLARATWNLLVDQHPAAVVLAESAADVAAAVRIASAHRVPLAVQATGHGVVCAADGALLINTSRMSAVEVDAAARRAWVRAGARFEALSRAAEPHGLAPAGAQSAGLGVVGVCLGGGCGWLSRRYGMAADAVRAIEVVTLDGVARRVDADHEPELFWALRGGGGNFGVVTGLSVDLFPVAGLVGGQLYYPGGLARQVLRTWRDLTRRAPDELTSQAALLNLPAYLPFMGMPELAHGSDIVAVGVCLVAPDRDALAGLGRRADDLLAPLRRLGPMLDTVAPRTPSGTAGIAGTPIGPQHAWGHSAMFAELPDALFDTVLVHAGPGTASPLASITFRHLGGAVARPGRGVNAVGHRDAGYLLHTLALSVDQPPDDAVLLRTDEVAAAMQTWSTGGVLPTFLGVRDAEPDRVRAAYGPVYPELARLKAEVDPDNLLRFNHNIEPAA
ncbi:MAG TPA: FAD-binding protein [Mycobacteriales bacterium]|nr:FAD-binding protein [Mycobacteriales bacterium]